MLFTRKRDKKKKVIRQEVAVEEKRSLFIGTPEHIIEVRNNITSTEARKMFQNWRQPSEEVFTEVLKMARETGKTATIIVDYNSRGHQHMPKVSENVYRNINRSYNEFWI